MSKSDPEDSLIALTDRPEDIRRKIRRAVTDSEAEIRFDPEGKPGVSNLLTILSVLSGENMADICQRLAGKGYGALKDETADAVIAALGPVQARYQELLADKAYLAQTLQNNAERAQKLAQRTLSKVYKKLGLYQP